nr:spore germination protein [Marininema halotolerans]
MFSRWLKKKEQVKHSTPHEEHIIHNELAKNLDQLKQLFYYAPDFQFKEITTKSGDKALLVYLEHIVDKVAINEHILKPLMYAVESIDEMHIPIFKTENALQIEEVEKSLYAGKSVLFVEGKTFATIFDTQGWPQRAIKEPQTESTLKGAHQGFVETAGQNIAIVRRYLPHRELTVKSYEVGLRGKTKVFMLFLKDVVNPEIVAEMEDRIQQVKTDAIINAGQLVEYIEDHPNSLFPQLLQTERPDALVANLLQGRFAIIVDLSPYAIVGPMTLTSFFQSVDDYSTRWVIASFARLLRFFAFFITITLPSFYIAAITFHYEILPLDLLISIGVSREKVPFPPIIEAIVMEISLEMIREAGVRLPAPIGQTIGVVGGIVIGQAAVQAGVVSNIMVIVVAITAISSFIIPNLDVSLGARLIRFPMMLIATIYGLVGIAVGLMIVFANIINMESLGEPYGSPFSPIKFIDWKDTWVRFPLWKMDQRPTSTNSVQTMRQRTSRKGRDR